MPASSTNHHVLNQLNILLVIIPYIFSLLELGFSAVKGTFCTKKIDADSKYAI